MYNISQGSIWFLELLTTSTLNTNSFLLTPINTGYSMVFLFSAPFSSFAIIFFSAYFINVSRSSSLVLHPHTAWWSCYTHRFTHCLYADDSQIYTFSSDLWSESHIHRKSQFPNIFKYSIGHVNLTCPNYNKTKTEDTIPCHRLYKWRHFLFFQFDIF